MDAGKLNELTKRGLNEAGFTWIMKAFEHQTHHRPMYHLYSLIRDKAAKRKTFLDY